jgi:hypothetical protein
MSTGLLDVHFVVVINRVFWRPLYLYAERKFRLG